MREYKLYCDDILEAAKRDILAHEYFGIDLEVVWDIVKNKLPILKKQIHRILNKRSK